MLQVPEGIMQVEWPEAVPLLHLLQASCNSRLAVFSFIYSKSAYFTLHSYFQRREENWSTLGQMFFFPGPVSVSSAGHAGHMACVGGVGRGSSS